MIRRSVICRATMRADVNIDGKVTLVSCDHTILRWCARHGQARPASATGEVRRRYLGRSSSSFVGVRPEDAGRLRSPTPPPACTGRRRWTVFPSTTMSTSRQAAQRRARDCSPPQRKTGTQVHTLSQVQITLPGARTGGAAADGTQLQVHVAPGGIGEPHGIV